MRELVRPLELDERAAVVAGAGELLGRVPGPSRRVRKLSAQVGRGRGLRLRLRLRERRVRREECDEDERQRSRTTFHRSCAPSAGGLQWNFTSLSCLGRPDGAESEGRGGGFGGTAAALELPVGTAVADGGGGSVTTTALEETAATHDDGAALSLAGAGTPTLARGGGVLVVGRPRAIAGRGPFRPRWPAPRSLRGSRRRRPVEPAGDADDSRVTPTSVGTRGRTKRIAARRDRVRVRGGGLARVDSRVGRHRRHRADALGNDAPASQVSDAREDLRAALVGERRQRLGHVDRRREARLAVARERAVHDGREALGDVRAGASRRGSGSVVKILKRISVNSPVSEVYGVRPASSS